MVTMYQETFVFPESFTITKINGTDKCIEGILATESKEELNTSIAIFSQNTNTRFVQWSSRDCQGKRLVWTTEIERGFLIPCFVGVREIQRCTFGGSHEPIKGKGKRHQESKKVGCEAKLYIKWLTLYENYKMPAYGASRRKKEKQLNHLKQLLLVGKECNATTKVLLKLPLKVAHTNHDVSMGTKLPKQPKSTKKYPRKSRSKKRKVVEEVPGNEVMASDLEKSLVPAQSATQIRAQSTGLRLQSVEQSEACGQGLEKKVANVASPSKFARHKPNATNRTAFQHIAQPSQKSEMLEQENFDLDCSFGNYDPRVNSTHANRTDFDELPLDDFLNCPSVEFQVQTQQKGSSTTEWPTMNTKQDTPGCGTVAFTENCVTMKTVVSKHQAKSSEIVEKRDTVDCALHQRQRPKVGVGVFVLSADHPNCVLVGKRRNSSGDGKYGLPGGHQEFGESWVECGSRETLEETGLRLKGVHFSAVLNCVVPGENYHYIEFFVQGQVDTQYMAEPINREPDKCHSWIWVDWDCFLPDDSIFEPLRAIRQQGFNPFHCL